MGSQKLTQNILLPHPFSYKGRRGIWLSSYIQNSQAIASTLPALTLPLFIDHLICWASQAQRQPTRYISCG